MDGVIGFALVVISLNPYTDNKGFVYGEEFLIQQRGQPAQIAQAACLKAGEQKRQQDESYLYWCAPFKNGGGLGFWSDGEIEVR